MSHRWLIVLLVAALFVDVGTSTGGENKDKAGAKDADAKKDAKDAKKTGAVVGVLMDRKYGDGVLVKGDGEESPRRYWRFSNRVDLNKQIDAIPLGSRVRLTWESPGNEGPHIASIEILKAAKTEKDAPKDGK